MKHRSILLAHGFVSEAPQADGATTMTYLPRVKAMRPDQEPPMTRALQLHGEDLDIDGGLVRLFVARNDDRVIPPITDAVRAHLRKYLQAPARR